MNGSVMRGRCASPRRWFWSSPAAWDRVSLASSLFDSSGRIQHACARFWARMVLTICGVRLKVSGDPQLRSDVPYVFFVNHQSHIDIPIVLAALPVSFRFAAKKELFRIPFLGWHLRRSGHIPVDRHNPHAAVKSFRGASERLRAGTSLVFFPEGATSLDGSIKSLQRRRIRSGRAIPRGGCSGDNSRIASCTGAEDVSCQGRPGGSDFGKADSLRGCTPGELTARVREEIMTAFENDKTLDRNTHSISR